MNKDQIRQYEEQLHISSKGFDNIIFVVSTGTFAVSITFLTGLRGYYLSAAEWLIGAWVCFGTAIIVQAISYKLAFIHASRVLDTEDDQSAPLSRKLIMVTEWAAFTGMAIGVFALGWFAGINFLAQNEISKYKTEHQSPPALELATTSVDGL